jgi:mono/diheme cytochrome c family protein
VRTARGALVAGTTCLAALALGGCTRTNNMSQQPYYRPYAASDFFPDGASARPLVKGTVPRSAVIGVEARPKMDAALLVRGRERFNIYCSPCHARDGYGRGMVVQRGFPPPPSYHTDRLRGVSDLHIYNVITGGLGKMPPYGPLIPSHDRWAIVAYVRALQRSQHATLADVPTAARSALASRAGATGGER